MTLAKNAHIPQKEIVEFVRTAIHELTSPLVASGRPAVKLEIQPILATVLSKVCISVSRRGEELLGQALDQDDRQITPSMTIRRNPHIGIRNGSIGQTIAFLELHLGLDRAGG
jgi:hypothetical protein